MTFIFIVLWVSDAGISSLCMAEGVAMGLPRYARNDIQGKAPDKKNEPLTQLARVCSVGKERGVLVTSTDPACRKISSTTAQNNKIYLQLPSHFLPVFQLVEIFSKSKATICANLL